MTVDCTKKVEWHDKTMPDLMVECLRKNGKHVEFLSCNSTVVEGSNKHGFTEASS